jgi:hypothetical protein
LLDDVFSLAKQSGLIEERAEASADATGLESHHVSPYFLAHRRGRTRRFRHYPKLTLVYHHLTYLIVAVLLRYGPCNDAPDFLPAVTQAVRRLPIDRLLADAAYDAEAHHRICREELGIRQTVIPINPRRTKTGGPTGRYRQQMHQRFPRRTYRRRWHAESVNSQHKRRLGMALRARTPEGRQAECFLRILVHDLMILRRAA